MSTTPMSTSSLLAVKKWEKKTWVQNLQQTAYGLLAGKGAIYDASAKFMGTDNRGDELTFSYTGKLTGLPMGEGETGYGNEEASDIGSYKMAVNITRIPVSNPNIGSIEQQRTNINFSEVTANNQAKRMAEFFDTSVFMQLAGSNPTSLTVNGTTYTTAAKKLHIQGHNTPTAPSTNRIIRAGAAATDQALTSSNTFSLDLLDYAMETMLSGDQPLEACNDGFFYAFLHPYQVTDLIHDTGSKLSWYTNQLAKEQGGKESQLTYQYSDKPIYLGQHGAIKIYQAGRVAFGERSDTSAVISTVRRAVLVGKDALAYASPNGGLDLSKGSVPYTLKTQLADYDLVKGQDLQCIYGLKKMSASNSEDIGSFVISTYAAAHS